MGGKKAPSAPKVQKVVSPFKNVKNYELNLDGFGSGYAGINGDKQTSSSSLAPGLQQANQTAQQGLNQNLQYLNQSPDQAYQELLSGGNSYYNQGKLQLDRSLNQGLSSADARFAANGLDNSTTRGAMMSTQLSDANLREAALQNESLNFLNARALGNMQANQGLIGGLAGIGGQLAQGAQGQFQYGTGTNVAIDQANVAAQNRANEIAYQQAVAEANKPGVWGTLANIGGTLAGAALGGPIGASMGGAISKGIGGLFGGGGAAASAGSAFAPIGQNVGSSPNYLTGSWSL
jgi:hypothetical protein